MAYTPTDWKNREVENPRTFEMQDNPNGVMLLPKEGNVIEPGTPIIADIMNNIEKGIAEAHDRLAGIGDVSQELTTHLADDVAHNRYGVATGTNTLVVTLSPAPTALKAGVSLRFKNTTANTGAVTLNINGLGAKSIVKNGAIALSSGNLKVGGVYSVLYDGTSFILQGEGGSGNALASDLLSGKTASTNVVEIVGSMPNNGSWVHTFTDLGTIAIPRGFHTGAGVVNTNFSKAKRFAMGTIPAMGALTLVSTTYLPFVPKTVIVQCMRNVSTPKGAYATIDHSMEKAYSDTF